MAHETLAQLEHNSQLVIYQIKNVSNLIAKAWFELELARSDLRDLMEIHEKWEEENGLNQELKQQ
ncbi:MAG: hypothetical protein JNJ47_03640 [Alphaproteobacteria bacterium]|nr:hypothetical protein [Alphaproteobacteria bacterium]